MAGLMPSQQRSHVRQVPKHQGRALHADDSQGGKIEEIAEDIQAHNSQLREGAQRKRIELGRVIQESPWLLHESKLVLLRSQMWGANAMTHAITAEILEIMGLW
jgi:hypothetical protein